MTGAGGRAVPVDMDRAIARLLTLGTYASVALLAVGVVLMVVAGIGPLSGGRPFDPAVLVDDVVRLRPTGFLWLGLVTVVATPAARVVASLIGFAARGDRAMATVAILILAVIALSVGLARGLEG